MSSTNATSSVRGYSAYNRPASLAIETAAFFTDVGIAFGVFFLLLLPSIRLFKLSAAPQWWWVGLFLVILSAVWVGQKLLIGRTLGDMLWRLKPKEETENRQKLHQKFQWKLYQCEQLDAATLATAIALTISVWTSSFWIAYRSLARSPAWLQAESWQISPFLPNNQEWVIAPFFYSLGAWPKVFNGRPVFYSVPYEKGPPTRFVGHVVARWASPDVHVTFEGPKTPGGGDSGISRTTIRECLVHAIMQAPFECLQIRDQVLNRHIEEIRARVSSPKWALRWFTVQNQSLSPEDQSQGIFISAWNDTKMQSRFILITPKGAHQAFILDTLKTPTGDLAERFFEQAIGSIRISDELNPGRAWVNQQLESIRLDELMSTKESETFLARLAEVQALLIAKTSVDPKTYDTYFHLAGTSLMLARYAAKNHLNDLAAAAKPLVQTAYRYAVDVGPKDPRNAQLHSFTIDSQKY